MYRMYAPMVSRRCHQLLRWEEAARDATHDVFVKFVQVAGRQDIEHPSALLWRIATNHCLNLIAKKSSGEKLSPEPLVLELACAFGGARQLEARSLIRQLFSSSHEKTRYIATLYYLDGMTHEQVAQELGMSVSGIRKQLRGVRARLHDIVESES